jgi:hypothetical protein
MTRYLFFAITLIGTGVLLNSPAEAATSQCEDKAANCMGRCVEITAGQATGGYIRANVCPTATGG